MRPSWPPGQTGQMMHVQFSNRYDILCYVDPFGWLIVGVRYGQSDREDLLVENYEGYTLQWL